MTHPNILWICTDQQRYDTIHALGNQQIRTPHVDRLVAEGTAFTHAYCQSPICTPSRASFLTGMYPSRVHGCMNGNVRWADAAPLVTKLLADAGYDGALAGKLHLAGAAGRVEPRPSDDGYRVFHWSHDPEDRWSEGHAYAEWIRAQGQDLGALRADPARTPPALHQTTWCADRAIDFMQDHADDEQPWFVSVNIFDPHSPFDPPREYLDRYDSTQMPGPLYRESDLDAQAKLTGIDFQKRAKTPVQRRIKDVQAAYYAMIELIDHNVGRMMDALERSGQRENTIVIFMSDHGETLGDHGLLLKGCRFYEGLVRVPLVIAWPGRLMSGQISSALVELTDVAPTLLDLCDLTVPGAMQGRSLRPILQGQIQPHEHRETVRCEYYRALNPDAKDEFVGSYATMIRDRRYKLVVYHGHDQGELFDLEEDPGEFENRWDDPACADVRFRLLKRSFDDLALAVDTGPAQVTRF